MDAGTAGSGLGALFSIGGGIFSAITGDEDQKKIAGIEKQIAVTQMQENYQRRTAMELTARRTQMQSLRQAQLARSMALTQSTSGGSQFGSGLQGGYASISGMTTTNMLGMSNNLEIGENVFNLSDQESEEKAALATAQSKAASDQAMGKLFGGIGGSMGDLFKFGSFLGGL